MLYGVFHGDLHGGNLMVRPDGRTVLMDFGITGRLDETKRMAFLMLLVGATSGDTMAQLGALRDLGAFPPDTDLDAVFRDLGLDRTIDPTTLSADELVHELQDLTKKLLAYGARAPKELMLFVKNMMFLDGAIARLAPDLDILGEIQQVHTEIALRHGARLAAELGIDPAIADQFDMEAVKAAMGVPGVETLTYREVQERREVVRQRLEEKRKRVASTVGPCADLVQACQTRMSPVRRSGARCRGRRAAARARAGARRSSPTSACPTRGRSRGRSRRARAR